MELPSFRHWYERLDPVAVTLKFATAPGQTATSAGEVVITGSSITVSVAVDEVIVPQLPETVTE